MEDIMDMIDYAEIGKIMNIEENFQIDLYKSNLLIRRKKMKQTLFEIAITPNTTHVPIIAANIQSTPHITSTTLSLTQWHYTYLRGHPGMEPLSSLVINIMINI
jgi:hypothetical protein